MRHDPLTTILGDLLRRVDSLADEGCRMSAPQLGDEVDQIRHIARAFHIDAIESLADTLQSALSLQSTGPVILCYLDLLRDAIASAMPGARACPPAALSAPPPRRGAHIAL